MSRRVSTSFEPSLKEALAQAKYQGYIQGIEQCLQVAHNYDEGSAIFSGMTLVNYIEALEQKLKEFRGKYQRRFHKS